MASLAASHAKGKMLHDVIFATAGRAQADMKVNGKENVLNGTVGAILDEQGDLVFLHTVRKEYNNLSTADHVGYAPVKGLPEFLDAAQKACFGDSKPNAYTAAIATAGGTGALHHIIHNYMEVGDEALVADWYWGNYRTLCSDNGRTLSTYTLFDDNNQFNHASFHQEVNRLSDKQKNVVIIINSPGNNPTGYTIADEDWQQILQFLQSITDAKGTNFILAIDVAYLDYSGDGAKVRTFFRLFENLPSTMLAIVCYSLSKGFTLYGQRVGAMIGISNDKEVIEEYENILASTSRATWSNICRPAMKVFANIVGDCDKYQEYQAEREQYNQLIHERAQIFIDEATAAELPMLPYLGGFFITIPTKRGKEICEHLEKEHIYVIPLANGIRIAACSIPKRQMKGLASTMARIMRSIGAL